MGERVAFALVAALTAATVACGLEGPPAQHVVPSYDAFTSRLLVLAADQNGDGRLDQWTYLDGNIPLRGEADVDGDGRIDRWEYFGRSAELIYVGTSSQNDGVEDTRTWISAENGAGRIDRSQRRDRIFDRREYFNGQDLVRAEQDTNADGRIDRWDRYEGGKLREVQFDTTRSSPRANWRITYDAQGHFVAAETDQDGDGRFERPPAGTIAPVAPPGGKKE